MPWGISRDTGFVRNGATSREPFTPRSSSGVLRIIRDDLHCNAVRLHGAVTRAAGARRHPAPISAWRSGSRLPASRPPTGCCRCSLTRRARWSASGGEAERSPRRAEPDEPPTLAAPSTNGPRPAPPRTAAPARADPGARRARQRVPGQGRGGRPRAVRWQDHLCRHPARGASTGPASTSCPWISTGRSRSPTGSPKACAARSSCWQAGGDHRVRRRHLPRRGRHGRSRSGDRRARQGHRRAGSIERRIRP